MDGLKGSKDWVGNKNSIYKTLGASNHTDKGREVNDYYATDGNALRAFLDRAKLDGIDFGESVWECACGGGHLSDVLKEYGYEVLSSDIIDRGYAGTNIIDFLQYRGTGKDISIITNPPYKYAKEFIENALSVVTDGRYVVMFLKVQFLEGKARRVLFDKSPIKYIYVHSARQLCAKNADFEGMINGGGSAVAYAWYVWEKGFVGETVIRWI